MLKLLTGYGEPGALLTELEERIVQLIIKDPAVSRAELAKALGIGADTVKEYLGKLREKDIIERIGGNTRAGRWRLKS